MSNTPDNQTYVDVDVAGLRQLLEEVAAEHDKMPGAVARVIEISERDLAALLDEVAEGRRLMGAVIKDHDQYAKPYWSSTAIELGRTFVARHPGAGHRG